MTASKLQRPEPKEKKETIWTSKERENHKEEYGCEILVENGTLEQVSITNAPSDACIITYEYNGKVCRDLTRGVRVKLFDMYYDKFKMGLKVIDYGRGTVKPNLWGYSSTPQKKKRK
tara:strand:+ start:1070 stop:1420 length:351 start_codon:yes stop_codon:yes gene_type:complete